MMGYRGLKVFGMRGFVGRVRLRVGEEWKQRVLRWRWLQNASVRKNTEEGSGHQYEVCGRRIERVSGLKSSVCEDRRVFA